MCVCVCVRVCVYVCVCMCVCVGLRWGTHGCYLTVLEPLEGNNFVANGWINMVGVGDTLTCIWK